MRNAQREAGVGPADISGVYAHGTGTPKGDIAEIHALNDVFAERIATLPVTSLKGHGSSRQVGVGDEPRRRHGRDATRRDPADGLDRQPRSRGAVRLVLEQPEGDRRHGDPDQRFGFGGQNASMVFTPTWSADLACGDAR